MTEQDKRIQLDDNTEVVVGREEVNIWYDGDNRNDVVELKYDEIDDILDKCITNTERNITVQLDDERRAIISNDGILLCYNDDYSNDIIAVSRAELAEIKAQTLIEASSFDIEEDNEDDIEENEEETNGSASPYTHMDISDDKSATGIVGGSVSLRQRKGNYVGHVRLHQDELQKIANKYIEEQEHKQRDDTAYIGGSVTESKPEYTASDGELMVTYGMGENRTTEPFSEYVSSDIDSDDTLSTYSGDTKSFTVNHQQAQPCGDNWEMQGVVDGYTLGGLSEYIDGIYKHSIKFVVFTNNDRTLLVPESEVQP